MQLDHPDFVTLLEVLNENFGPANLTLLLATRLNIQLHNLANVNQPYPNQVLDIAQHFQQNYTTERLVAVLRDARPAVPKVAQLADRVGLLSLPAGGGLELLVRPAGTPYQDVTTFRADLSAREAAVCQIESPAGVGTGVLIADDLVLTNYHVIADSLDEDGGLEKVICRFDFKKAAQDSYTTPATCVDAPSVVAHSEYATADTEAGGENLDKNKLDYALLRLSQKIGSQPIVAGGSPRGHVQIKSKPAAAKSDGLLVLQHPLGEPMKIDIGAVTWTGETRLRHSVNTEPGSSGAPMFDAALDLVALHHAGHSDWPTADLGYNQAIPISLILADFKSRNLGL